MYVSSRSYLTAGIAVLGAGALALAPVAPMPDRVAALPHHAVSDIGAAVLLSSFDPITPWVDTITTSVDNIAALIGYAFSNPFPIASAVVSDPGLALSNFTKLFTAPFSPGETFATPVGQQTDNPGDLVFLVPTNNHLSATDNGGTEGLANPLQLVQLLSNLNAGEGFTDPACYDDGVCSTGEAYGNLDLFTVNAFTMAANTYATGAVLGLLGPVLAPAAALLNSVTAIVDFIGDGDVVGALNELVNIPANLVNGFLNGAVLNLTPIVNLIAPLDGLFVGLNLGGLLAGPAALNGSFIDPADPPTEFSPGTLLDALVVQLELPVAVQYLGQPIGPVGSLIGMGQFLGQQLLTPPAPAAPAGADTAAAEQATATETVVAEAVAEDALAEAVAEDALAEAVAEDAAAEAVAEDALAEAVAEDAAAEEGAAAEAAAAEDTADGPASATPDTAADTAAESDTGRGGGQAERAAG
jgi:hypothetical protein